MPTLDLKPTSIPEWNAELMVAGRLGGQLRGANHSESDDLFNQVDVSLPQDIEQRFLPAFDMSSATPLNVSLLPDSSTYDYYLLEVPVTIVLPGARSLVWLGLSLDVQADSGTAVALSALPYSLFPMNQWKDKEWDIGSLSIDTAKALDALLPGLGKITSALSFKLEFPLKWESTHPIIQCTNKLHNPAKWIVKDEAIRNGFNAYLIVRSLRGVAVKVHATLQAVIVKGRIFACRETPPPSRVTYTLKRR